MHIDSKLVRKWLRKYEKMRRRLSKKKILGLTSICLVALLIYCLYEWKILCSHKRLQTTIDTVCSHFANGKAHGNLCRQFCVTGDLQPKACQTFHAGKEVVFQATLENLPIFVKGRRMDFMSHPEEALHWGSEVFPSENDFQMMVQSYLSNNMGIQLPKNANLMDTLWFKSKDEPNLPQHPDIANWQRSNVWSLIQDNEYVLSKLHASLDVFPTLMGTCGGLYVVEALEPLSYPHYLAKLSFSQWAQRVSVALAILDLLDELENVFDQPIHLCDVKPEHFGISDFGKVKVLDLDSVFLKPYLDKTMTDNITCESHNDCDFFDCKGQCDLITNKCTKGVVNNNLQVVCEKILLSRSGGLVFSLPGLLTSNHLNKRLDRLLKKCANPTGNKNGIRLEASAETRIELYKALREVMDIARQVDHDEEDFQNLDREI